MKSRPPALKLALPILAVGMVLQFLCHTISAYLFIFSSLVLVGLWLIRPAQGSDIAKGVGAFSIAVFVLALGLDAVIHGRHPTTGLLTFMLLPVLIGAVLMSSRTSDAWFQRTEETPENDLVDHSANAFYAAQGWARDQHREHRAKKKAYNRERKMRANIQNGMTSPGVTGFIRDWYDVTHGRTAQSNRRRRRVQKENDFIRHKIYRNLGGKRHWF